MLEEEKLRQTLKSLVLGGVDIALYGTKSSGKTTLAHSVLTSCLGRNRFIHIKGILVSSKDSFLKLFNEELNEILRNFNEEFICNEEKEEELSMNQTSNEMHLPITRWLLKLNRLIRENEEMFHKIKQLYMLIDNVEELNFRDSMLSKFYESCKRNVEGLKISFFFVGQNLPERNLHDELPYRFVISFFMPKPNMLKVIEKEMYQRLEENGHKGKEHIRLVEELKQIVFHSLESLEFKIETVRKISNEILHESYQFIKAEKKNISIWLDSDELKNSLKKMIEYGAVSSERLFLENTKKDLGLEEWVEGDHYFIHEGYPNLIMSSLYMANGFSEDNDRMRFIDYTKTNKRTRSKFKKRGAMALGTFKKEDRYIKHNMQRIISISEILEEQSNTELLKERHSPHHNLDYYGCFEYLREEGKIGYYGSYKSSNRSFGGRIYGEAKESEVRDFFKQVDLDYKQFID